MFMSVQAKANHKPATVRRLAPKVAAVIDDDSPGVC
jgi:hypothetical protein